MADAVRPTALPIDLALQAPASFGQETAARDAVPADVATTRRARRARRSQGGRRPPPSPKVRSLPPTAYRPRPRGGRRPWNRRKRPVRCVQACPLRRL